MKLKNVLIWAAFICSSSYASAATPESFFQKGVTSMDENAKNIKIVFSFDPFKHASRVLQYIDRAAYHTIDPDRVAWAFYRIQYTQSDGTIQDCVGGIGKKLGFPATRRIVNISSCNQGFFETAIQYDRIIDL